MYDHDWFLILFTLMLQMSAGGFIFLALATFFKKELGNTSFFRKKMLWLFLISIAGLILAFFHLGSPLHALNALNNLGSSWMSMEILSVIVLIITLFLINLTCQKFLKINKGILISLYLLGMISSIVLIYSMAKIYYEPTIESWYKETTWIEFISAAVVLGALFAVLGAKSRIKYLIYMLFILIIIIEVTRRMSFYASFQSIGI